MFSSFKPEEHIFRSSQFQQLIQNAVDFLLSTPVQTLPPSETFTGAGLYLLYYTGNFPPYSAIAQANNHNLSTPIYAGKAVPSGWRQARTPSKKIATLYRRLSEHGTSIRAAQNLNLRDFSCRFVILTDDESSMIPAVEASLIRQYQPLWNSVIDGFGNHDPGINRYGQLLAEWDTLHPGRSWERKWQGQRPNYEQLIDKIQNYFG